RVVLSWPRVDIEQARPRVPSFYGLEALRAASGRLPGFDELEARGGDKTGGRLGWPAPPRPADAIDEAEYDLALLAGLRDADPATTAGSARHLLAANVHLGRALRARGPRRLRRWTPAREPRRGARGGRWRARDGGHALGREALAGNRPGVEGRYRRHPRRPARVAAARGGRGRRLGPVALRAVLRARRPRPPAGRSGERPRSGARDRRSPAARVGRPGRAPPARGAPRHRPQDREDAPQDGRRGRWWNGAAAVAVCARLRASAERAGRGGAALLLHRRRWLRGARRAARRRGASGCGRGRRGHRSRARPGLPARHARARRLPVLRL